MVDMSYDMDPSVLEHEGDSMPIPTHIPYVTAVSGKTYTAEESFQEALNASYWLGYWSAIHKQKVSRGVA